jgi:hypothetical protein
VRLLRPAIPSDELYPRCSVATSSPYVRLPAPEAARHTGILSGGRGPLPRRSSPRALAAPATSARESLWPPTPVPEAVAAGQHDALAAAPVRAGEHYLFPGLHTSVSHAPSVAPGARPFTVNPLEVERGCASREPAPQVHGTCARGRGFRYRRFLPFPWRCGVCRAMSTYPTLMCPSSREPHAQQPIAPLPHGRGPWFEIAEDKDSLEQRC